VFQTCYITGNTDNWSKKRKHSLGFYRSHNSLSNFPLPTVRLFLIATLPLRNVNYNLTARITAFPPQILLHETLYTRNTAGCVQSDNVQDRCLWVEYKIITMGLPGTLPLIMFVFRQVSTSVACLLLLFPLFIDSSVSSHQQLEKH